MLLWIIPSVISGGREYAYELLIIQTFGRAVNSFAHQRPFYYYLETFSGTFLPWSFFLYSSFIYYLRSRKNAPKFIKFLVVWFVSAFILFSVISGKLDIYLLPIYPAGALLTAYLFRQVREKKASSFYIVVPAVLTLVLLGIAAFFIPEEAEGIAVRSLLLPTITVWVLGAFICIYLILKKNTKYIYHLVLITFSVFLFNFSISVAPAFSDSYTVKPAALYLKKLKGLEYNNIGVYKFEGDTEALNIYTDFWPEAVENVEDLSLYLAKPNSALMIEKEKWDSLENIIELKGKFKVIEVSNNYLVIIR
jgi:4-amino-4-deoxy-L-arabinose transferase-like glycosyltransferase